MTGFDWLYLGFVLSAIIVFLTDFRLSQVPLQAFIPALFTSIWFYWSVNNLPILILNLKLDALVTALGIGILFVASRRVGTADIVAIAVFSLWPVLGAMSVTFAVLPLFVFHGVLKGRRYMPSFRFAGWLALMVIPVGAWMLGVVKL